ncbi:hypothetical protein F511_34670 [Dorcoceras hygrometricum]|uniref:Uncharacterized protein n=1 Tax=Dorcoceras hygrometricum TaxID=472368 RepID=A0A2Z7AL82_9LAMI|nr:hypothetical protein F511_34670 [Dorcoceras hygrometricum]
MISAVEQRQKINPVARFYTSRLDCKGTKKQTLRYKIDSDATQRRVKSGQLRRRTAGMVNPAAGRSNQTQEGQTRRRKVKPAVGRQKSNLLRDKVLRKFQPVLSQNSVQATIQQVRNLGRIRAIELLPNFFQLAGFVLPEFTPDSYTRLYQVSDFLFVFRLLFEHPSVQTSVSCQTPFALIFAVVIWGYEIFRISGLLCVTNGLDPLEEHNLGTDQ